MALLEPWQWNSYLGDLPRRPVFLPTRIVQADCPNQNPLSAGCWVMNTPGAKHDYYFTTEARHTFVYDSTAGLTLQFSGPTIYSSSLTASWLSTLGRSRAAAGQGRGQR